ncbi:MULTISPECIES: hypothetical protein [Campylobacter]|uniref:hypothetical protein n=1 Tax=Campylobacter TaxID=194 RepID=UPI000A358E8B|nr:MULTISPECIES: hypothetical protein [unclassified Campylobacter]MCR8678859.1 hypothetical protein [Campylobacter sp. RM19072]MCR8695944.1 hypothetical protein [Campylobacter sp. RM19073]
MQINPIGITSQDFSNTKKISINKKDGNMDTQESKGPTAMIQETIELLEEQLERLKKQLSKVEGKIKALSSIPNEYAKNMLMSLTEQATDLITKITTISARILELQKALA